jgi:MFS family permease
MKTPTTRDYLAISLYWLAPSFFWGAMLYVVLQTQMQNLATLDLASLNLSGDKLKTEVEGLSSLRLGWLLGVGALVATVSQLFFGALSDSTTHRVGRRKPFLIAGVIAGSIAIAVYPLAKSYPAMFALFLCIQLFLNMAAGPYQALLPDLIEAQYHGRAAAFMGFFQLMGRTGGMVIGALILMKRPHDGLWILMILSVVLLNGLMFATATLTHEQQFVASTRETLPSRLRAMFRFDLRGQASFVWVLASRFVVNTGIYTIMPFLQYYLQNTFSLTQQQTLSLQITIGLTVNIAGLVATFPAGIAGDRFSKKAVVYFTGAICVAGGLGFALTQSTTGALIAAGVFGIGYGAFSAIDWALVCNVLPPGEPAKYMGLWGFADTVPQIVAPLLGGAITAIALRNLGPENAYRVTLLSAVFWFALGTVLIRFVRERNTASTRGEELAAV